MQTESFRRSADGSIDYDFYRQAAVAERRAAIKDVASSFVVLARRLVQRARAGAALGAGPPTQMARSS